jgi:protein-tyrosine kinase
MDKLGAALERLRDQESPRNIRPIPGVHTSGKPGHESVREIVYTRTRVMPVATDVLQDKRIALAANHALADAYKLLRTQLLMRMRDNGWNTIAVTSPGRYAGKTSVAINLAVSLALEMDQTVLLVDADLRHPNVANVLGLPVEKGLSDYLSQQTPIEDMLIHPGIGRLVVLPGNQALNNSAELLRSPMMVDLVRDLKHRYANRIIVFDLPPVLEVADTLAFSPLVDASILVVEEHQTPREEIEQACSLLKATHLLGVVLNKSKETKMKRLGRGFLRKWFDQDEEMRDV